MASAPTLVAALLGPAAVVGGWLQWAGAFAEPTYQGATSPFATALAARLADNPDVVVLGNSQAKSAVDQDALADLLGRPGEVEHAGVGGGAAPTIWAVAKHQVFDPGASPRLLIVPMAAAHLLTVSPPTGNNAVALAHAVRGPDPVLDAKVFGVRDRRLDAAITTSQGAREAALAALTAWPLRLIGEPEPAAAMDRARDAVFGEVAGSQLVLNARMIPVVEASARPDDPTDQVDLDATLVPDLIDLAAAHGARVVFVILPQRARYLETPASVLRRLTDYVEARGAALVRLDQVAVPADAWLDAGHVNPRGAAVVTDALAAALIAVGALEDGPLRHLPPPVDAPKVARRGAPPVPRVLDLQPGAAGLVARLDGAASLSDTALAALGLGAASPLEVRLRGERLPAHRRPADGCAPSFLHTGAELLLCLPPGTPASDLSLAWTDAAPHARRGARGEDELTAWWLPGDGALELTWDPPIDLAPGSALDVMLAPLDAAANVAPGAWTLRADGREVALSAWEGVPHAHLPLGDRLGRVTLTAADGASDTFLRALVLRQGPTTTWLAGRPEDRADRLVLVPGDNLTPSPRAVPEREIAGPGINRQRYLTWPLGGTELALTEARLIVAGQDARFGRCLPFEAAPVGDSPRLRADVHQTEAGRGWLALGRVDPDPGPDDAWTLRTRASRVCGGAAWIAPGETVRFAAAAPQALGVTTTRLDLSLAAFGSAGSVSVTLAGAGEAPLLTHTFDARSLDGAPVSLPLDAPLAPRPRRLSLTVTAPPDAWVLLGTAQLAGATAPPDAWFAVEPPAPTRLADPAVRTPTAVALPVQTQPATTAPAGPALFGLAALLADPALAKIAGRTAVTPDGGSLRVTSPPDTKAMVCTPSLPSRALRATARVRADAEGPLELTVRWLTDGVLLTGDAAAAATARARATPGAPADLSVDASPPPGADAARVCLRGFGAELRVDGWAVQALTQ